MPLDPQVEVLIAEMIEAGAKPMDQMTVQEARLGGWDTIALQGQPEEVAHIEHRFVPTPTADIPVRIYYPDGQGPFPALVYFHGSGWVVLNIEICDPTSRIMANRTGCAIIAVNYQKAPEHKFPTAVEDAWASLNWTVEHAEDLNVDPQRLGVMGDSAGGNLAAVTAIRARDQGGPDLNCQVLVYPVTDADIDKPSYHANAEGYLLQRSSMKAFYDYYLNNPDESNDPWVSPLHAKDLSHLPPALVITAEYDPLLDDGRLYAEKLKAAGVETVYSEYAGMVHGFFYNADRIDASQRLHDEIGVWVRSHM